VPVLVLAVSNRYRHARSTSHKPYLYPFNVKEDAKSVRVSKFVGQPLLGFSYAIRQYVKSTFLFKLPTVLQVCYLFSSNTLSSKKLQPAGISG